MAPIQNKEIFKKTQESSVLVKQFGMENIWYQGSYELDFLEKYYNKYKNIQRGCRVKYIFKNKEHYYFPDFYIPSLNLIVECKNSYLAKRDQNQIQAKEKATIANGFNYIMIIDKKYSELNKKY